MKSRRSVDTELLYRGNHIPGIAELPDTPPIYHATAYAVKDTDDYDRANRGEKYFYNRTANPNRDCLGEIISYLEYGENTIICSSGMAAISTTLIGLLKAGGHIIVNRSIYGETIELLNCVLYNYGVEVDYVDLTDLSELERAFKPNTVLIYTEIIANPLTAVVDIEKVAKLAKEHGALTVVDSTFTTPCVIRPLEFGADIVIHSLTKYFGGHSDLTGGSITASETLIRHIQRAYLLLGCCMDPNSAWLFARSARTMFMRVRRQNENANAIAKALKALPCVKVVYHPSLTDHPQHTLAEKLFTPGMYGAMISFQVENDLQKVNAFLHRLELIQYLGTLGGIRTSVTHPATAFKNEFSEAELHAMGLWEGLIRISVGAEDATDLINDLSQALQVFNE